MSKKNKTINVTVITVVLNSVRTIESSIKSVLNQSYPNIEYIIIDGGSTDGTLDVIRKYNKKISKWVSEPDQGVYDAMNKGVKMSTGEIIYFLGADDEIKSKKTISDVVNVYYRDRPDFIYGKIESYKHKNHKKLIIGGKRDLNGLKRGESIYHQATFSKREILEREGFYNVRYPLIADTEFFYRCYLKGYSFLFVNKVVAKFSPNGLSSNSRVFIKEKLRLMNNYFGAFYSLTYFIRFVARGIFKKFINYLE